MKTHSHFAVLSAVSLALWPSPGLSQQRDAFRRAKAGGAEIVAVFITGSCCTKLVPQLRPGIDRLREKLRAQADSEGVGFRMIGVSNDWNTDSGWAHLKLYGDFDEITVGSNWLSLPIERLVWQDSVTRPAVPQVVIYRHAVKIETTKIEIGPPQIIQRLLGWKEIQDWGRDHRLVP